MKPRVHWDSHMDDLLKVFLVETFEGLSECEADVNRLCEEADDPEPLNNILRLVGSIRETSSFLGLPGLHAAAVTAFSLLTNFSNGMAPGGAAAGANVRRAIADIKSSIVQLEQSVAGADPIYEAHRRADRPGASPAPAAPRAGPKKKQTLTELFASDDAKSAQAKPQTVAPTQPVPTVPATAEALTVPGSGPIAPAQPSVPPVVPNTADLVVAPVNDGTVRISAETLDNLLSTVRQLMASQSEMMQLLKQRDDAARQSTSPPLANPIEPAQSSVSTELSAAAVTPATAAKTKTEPNAENIVSLPTRRVEPTEPSHTGIRPAPAPVPQSVKLLVFQTTGGATKAIRADLVDNVREVDLKSLDGARGLWVLRTDARLVPLVPVDGGTRQLAEGLMPAILCCIDGAWMGLLVRSVLGTVDTDLTMASASGRHNRIATAQINGSSIDVIDPARCLSDAIDGSAPKSRSLEPTKAPGASPTSTVVRASDLFERKPTR